MSVRELVTGAAAPSGAAAATAHHSSGSSCPLAAPVMALMELGILDDGEASSAVVEDISRAHPVWRVRLADGRRLVLKAGLGHGGPDLAVECLVYRMTWWCEQLAAALPTPLVVDEDRQLLVLADVGGSGSLAQRAGWSSLLTGAASMIETTTTTVDETIWSKLGRTVGSLHRVTSGYPLPSAPPPLVLSVVGRAQPDRTTAQLSDLVAAAVGRLGAHPVITSAVEELRRPVAGCLVNHDLKWDNVVLDASGPTGGSTPVLLDWELAGLGDPAWDLGCLLAEHLIRTRTSSSEPCPDQWLDASAQALLQGYRDGARPKTAVVAVLARRTALASGLRIAQLALEVAWTPYSGSPGAIDRLTDRALLVLGAAGLTEEVRQCLARP